MQLNNERLISCVTSVLKASYKDDPKGFAYKEGNSYRISIEFTVFDEWITVDKYESVKLKEKAANG